MLVLDTHDASTPLSEEVSVVVELGLEVLLEKIQFGDVLLLDISQGDGGHGLLVDELSESSLSLDEAERDTHLSAQGGEVHDQLEGLDVVGDHDKVGFLLLDERGHVVETVLEHDGLGSLLLGVLAGVLELSLLDESLLLLLLVLGGVLSEELNQLISYNK